MEIGFRSPVEDADVYLYKDIAPLSLLPSETEVIGCFGVNVHLCAAQALSAFRGIRLWYGNLGKRCSLYCRGALLQDQPTLSRALNNDEPLSDRYM